jgi:hypothetical protein
MREMGGRHMRDERDGFCGEWFFHVRSGGVWMWGLVVVAREGAGVFYFGERWVGEIFLFFRWVGRKVWLGEGRQKDGRMKRVRCLVMEGRTVMGWWWMFCVLLVSMAWLYDRVGLDCVVLGRKAGEVGCTQLGSEVSKGVLFVP